VREPDRLFYFPKDFPKTALRIVDGTQFNLPPRRQWAFIQIRHSALSAKPAERVSCYAIRTVKEYFRKFAASA
jgi:hypothetical protein